jgi:hypothetical protein
MLFCMCVCGIWSLATREVYIGLQGGKFECIVLEENLCTTGSGLFEVAC